MPPTKEELLQDLRRERADFLDLISSLPAGDWELPTQLKGWRVRDIVAHLLGNCSGEFDEAFRRALRGDPAPVIPGDLNAWNEAQAAARRDWPPERFREEYEPASAEVIGLVEQWDAGLETPVRLAEAIPPRPFWLEARVLAAHHWVHGQDVRKAAGRPGGVTDERVRLAVGTLFDMMPLFFDADRAGDLRLAVAFDLSGPGGGRWLVEVDGRSCTVRSGREGRAGVTFRGSAWDFYRVGQGLLNPVLAVLTLKLVPAGNPLRALQFVRLFRTGKAAVSRPVEARTSTSGR